MKRQYSVPVLALLMVCVGCALEGPQIPIMEPVTHPWSNTPFIPVTPPPPELAWAPPQTPLQRLGLDGFVALAPPTPRPKVPRRVTSALPADAGAGPVRRVTIAPRELLTVPTTPGQPTYLLLPEGERLAAPLALDEEQWVSALVEMGQAEQRRETVVVRPLTLGAVLKTGLLFKSGLFFFLELVSGPKGGWLAVECSLPQGLMDAPPPSAMAPAPLLPPQIALDHYDDAYTITTKAKHVPWLPTRAFRDGRNTFLLFPEALAATRAPVVYALASKKKRILVEQQPYTHPDPTRGQLWLVKGDWRTLELLDSTGVIVKVAHTSVTQK